MFATNPFSILAETVPSLVIQGFVVLMVLLIVAGSTLSSLRLRSARYSVPPSTSLDGRETTART